MAKSDPRVARKKRHKRVTVKVKGVTVRPRLCVFRSLNHTYAQLIDDSLGHTLTAVSSLDPELRDGMAGKVKREQAELVGLLVAKRALS
ncbi:50S ribosomal protein L18, partial [Desulfobacteraceae bacterium SEEP-SAG9]